MSEFKEIFEEYGADYKDAMSRFMGNENMYIKLLDMFFLDENYQKLGTALDNKDMKGAFEAAHTLKGVVGNMGLTPLFQAVCNIVEPLRTRQHLESYQDMYEQITAEFQKADEFREKLKGGK